MNFLFVIHNWIGYAPYGGTEVHAKNIVDFFKKNSQHQIYVLFPDLRLGGAYSNYLFLNTKTQATQRIQLNIPISPECYNHVEWTDIVTSLIFKYKIELVHFFHLLTYPLNFPIIAQQAGAKVIISLHDYYFICPQYNLLKKEGKFCGYPDISIETCDLCLNQLFNYRPNTQSIRRQLISEILYYTDAIHYASNDQKKRVLTTYPHLQDKLSLTMGVGLDKTLELTSSDINASLPNELEGEIQSNKPLQVACIGNFSSNKGADFLIDIIDYYQKQKPTMLQFHIYGELRSPYKQVLQNLAQSSNLRLYGSYKPEQLPQLLQGGEVALFASTWPETFVLTLSEAWSCSLVPIAPKIGAFQERIVSGENGFLYELENPGSLIKIFNELAQDKSKLTRILHNINRVDYPSLKDNFKEYLALYEKVEREPIDLKRVESLSRLVMSTPSISWYGQGESPTTVIGLKPSLFKRAWRFYQQQGLELTILRSWQFAKAKLHSSVKWR